MIGRVLLLLALQLPVGAAMAQSVGDMPAECRVAEHLVENGIPLPRVTKAIANKRLSILVVGAGSSLLPGPNGAQNAYPARLRAALAEKFPGVEISLATDVKARRTALEMVKVLPEDIAAAKPELVVWQTGTVDAMQGVDQDEFSQALGKGIAKARAAGADVVLVNSQYSPRTDAMIALGSYGETLRWVAVQREVPLFDRFSVMKLWGDLGTFDLYSATKKLDIAGRVHDCIGRLLADLIVAAAKPEAPPAPAPDK
ncbi:SGNH/GDSL hydrolase family protein [Pseudolabrys taiwanensis]|uniref:SGNH/GDSL hydrolase family protein n=2 Tax=Pseudolabrys taiwanensis TaxID=331696 RepID=A0A346A1E9_9HYPH|nr:SGNH/GDSL hydrolase family protein [Pseudolabrys taiwanensis]